MPDELRTKLTTELYSKFPPELVEDLIGSYEKVLVEYRKAAWDETLWKAGKFVENVFRLLYFIVHSKVLHEVPSMNDLKTELEKSSSATFDDSVRILIPRISTAMIYDPRSKKGAVHVKPIDPDYLDATLAVSACDWVLAELLRVYNTKDPEEIQHIIQSILVRKVPFVEKHGGQSYVTVPLNNAGDEVLMLLLDNRDGMDRRTIGKSLENNYTPGRVTQALDELMDKNKRYIILRPDKKYAITGPGESYISGVLSKRV
jgi:hypothetical protein